MTSSHSASPTNTDPPRLGLIGPRLPPPQADRYCGTPNRSPRHRPFGCLSPGLPGSRSGMAATRRSPGASTRRCFPDLRFCTKRLDGAGKPHPIGLRHVLLPMALFLLIVLWIGLQGAAGLFPARRQPGLGNGRRSDRREAGRQHQRQPRPDRGGAAPLDHRRQCLLARFAAVPRRTPRAGSVAAIALVGAGYAAYGLIATKDRLAANAGYAAKRRRVGNLYQSRFLCGLCRDRLYRDDRNFPPALPEATASALSALSERNSPCWLR